VTALLLMLALSVPAQVALEPGFTLELEHSGNIGNPTQMTFGPDGRLYVASLPGLIFAFDYGPSGVTSGPQLVGSGVAPSLLGLGFDGDGTLYISGSDGLGTPTSGFLARLLDVDDDGTWETVERFVDDLPTGLHFNGQLALRGHLLYVGLGSLTDDGERDGLGWLGSELSPPEPELGLSPQGAGKAAPAGPTAPAPGPAPEPSLRMYGAKPATVLRFDLSQVDFSRADNQPLVYAWGLRNAFGIALDEQGRVWVGENGADEGTIVPDELHLLKPGRHHGFPEDLAPPDVVPPVAPMGSGTSADGLVLYPSGGSWGSAYEGDVFIARFSAGEGPSVGEGMDVMRVQLSGDPDDPLGTATRFASGFGGPLDCEVDAWGNLLVLVYGGPGQVWRIHR
jgi:glucose/arabinose dehydrogenase